MIRDPGARIRSVLDRLAGDLPALGLAVSGGGDSIALMHVAAEWAQGRRVMVATVDHGLRPGSAAEARQAGVPAKPLIVSDFTQMAIRTLSQSFALGVQLAAPVLVFALIFNLASGLVARVMPSFQVYFAAAPLSVILGLSIFALSLGALGTVFIDRYRRLAEVFAQGVGGGAGG